MRTSVHGSARAADIADARAVPELLTTFVSGGADRSVSVQLLGAADSHVGRAGTVPRPAASLLKVPIVMAVVRAGHLGVLDLDRPVHRRDLPSSRHAALLDVLHSDHRFTVGELCGLALVTSDNPLASYLLDVVGMDAVTSLLAELGCTDTQLRVGFDDEALDRHPRANVTTTIDLLRILDALVECSVFASVRAAMARSVQSRRLTRRLRSELALDTAHKTGSLDGVCNDMAIIGDERATMVIALLCDHESDTGAVDLAAGHLALDVWTALRAAEP